MSAFYFNGEFQEEYVFPFLERVSKNPTEDIIIYFSTNGGNPSLAYVLADSLWRITKYDIKIKIVFYENAHSAAFLFLSFLQKMRDERRASKLREVSEMLTWSFLDTTYGILHSVTHLTEKEDNKEMYDTETKLAEQINKTFIETYAKKLTKQEKDAFKKGNNIVFDAVKLQNLFGGEIIKTS